MDIYSIQQYAFGGLWLTIILLLIALITKHTHGLFIARFPSEFVKDRNDPRYENERTIGNRYMKFVFKYVPPFFIGFLIIILMTYFV